MTRPSLPASVALLLTLGSMVAACTGASPGEQNIFPWHPGEYQIRGLLSYRNDTSVNERTERRGISALVRVGPSGPLSLESSDGPCTVPEPQVVQSDRVRGTRSFRCGETLFTFSRTRVNIGVTARADVYTTTRRRGGCVEYEVLSDGTQYCARYEYIVDSGWVSRSAEITAIVRAGD